MRKIDIDQQRPAPGDWTGAGLLALRPARGCGFTLVELLFVLALACVLVGVALPGFQALVAHQQFRAAVNDMFAAIDLTRSLALGRGSPVSLAPLDAGGTAWEKGWVVFIDSNANSRPDLGDEVIFRQGPVAEGMTIRSRFTSGTSPHYIAYNGAGRGCKTGNSQAAHWGTVTLEYGEQVRHIKMNMLGRVRVCDPHAPAPGCNAAD